MKKLTIENCQRLAESRGGKCLSKEYINSQTKLQWQCVCGYIWLAIPNNIKNHKKWCPKCGIIKNANKLKLTIEDCQNLAKSKNGKCLSTEYKNNKSQLKWKCKNEHIWDTSYSEINSGYWCSECAGNKKLTIDNCQKLAELRSGKCLSTEYINSQTKLEWQCKFNHTWWTITNKIQQGTWCPDCKIPISELICKYMIEQLFNKPFIKIKHEFLKNPKTNRKLELDLYNKELNIGLEHQGRHHYENNVYSKTTTTNTLSSQIERDNLKIKLCKLNNTKLIIIPELFKQTQLKDLQDFIISECKKQNIQLPENIPKIEININKIIRDWYNK